MIYFDENKEAYMQLETLKKFGKICIFSCEDNIYNDYLCGKYIWQENQLVLNPEWDNVLLNQAKQEKIKENDSLRDEALNQGVIYKNILFDSDTDQKVNLLAVISTIGDDEKIIWFGKDNNPLDCNKQDLINIGSLITQLHTFCWGKNAEIKTAINLAKTIEEVEAININYSLIL